MLLVCPGQFLSHSVPPCPAWMAEEHPLYLQLAKRRVLSKAAKQMPLLALSGLPMSRVCGPLWGSQVRQHIHGCALRGAGTEPSTLTWLGLCSEPHTLPGR